MLEQAIKVLLEKELIKFRGMSKKQIRALLVQKAVEMECQRQYIEQILPKMIDAAMKLKPTKAELAELEEIM